MVLILTYSLKSFTQTGRIEGNVEYLIDSVNVPEVQILVVGIEVEIETITNRYGHFKMDSLKPGTYDVVAQKIGYLNDLTKSVTVKNDSTTVLNLKLNRRLNTSKKCPIDNKSDQVIPIIYGLVRDTKRELKQRKVR